jgi:hypothetical protein
MQSLNDVFSQEMISVDYVLETYREMTAVQRKEQQKEALS